MGGRTNPYGVRLLLRELEKQRIRNGILAEEITRWRKWCDEVGMELTRGREPAHRCNSSAMRPGPYRFSSLGSPLLDTELCFRFQEALPFQRNVMTTTGVLNRKSADCGTSSTAGKETIALNKPKPGDRSSLKRKAAANMEADVRNTSSNKKLVGSDKVEKALVRSRTGGNSQKKHLVSKDSKFWCETCQVQTSSVKDMNCHKNGKAHLRALRLGEGKSTSSRSGVATPGR